MKIQFLDIMDLFIGIFEPDLDDGFIHLMKEIYKEKFDSDYDDDKKSYKLLKGE